MDQSMTISATTAQVTTAQVTTAEATTVAPPGQPPRYQALPEPQSPWWLRVPRWLVALLLGLCLLAAEVPDARAQTTPIKVLIVYDRADGSPFAQGH